MPIDLTKTIALFYDYAGPLSSFSACWLQKHIPRPERRIAVRVTPLIVARNAPIRDLVLKSDCEYVLSIDHDVTITTPGVEHFLALDADIASCECAMSNEHAWDEPDSFHCAFWWARIDVLRAIEPPWFLWRFSKDGCRLAACECQYLRDKARAAGFKIKHGGWCTHTNSKSW